MKCVSSRAALGFVALLLQLVVVPAALGQGVVYFNNRVTGSVDARVVCADRGGIGAGYTAQLYGGPAGTPLAALTPLFPTTTFRTSSAAAQGYINGVVVAVPGVAPGAQATLVMRVYPTGSVFTGIGNPDMAESNVITIALGGDLLPPTNLTGLNFSDPCIPEPSSCVLALLGFLLGLFFKGRA